ncbi:hypothetical protein PV341_26255 [Streptomyces sp. PA03-1a]|nr:hypothetical protein [Streptomyces sp. PA03-1a]
MLLEPGHRSLGGVAFLVPVFVEAGGCLDFRWLSVRDGASDAAASQVVVDGSLP